MNIEDMVKLVEAYNKGSTIRAIRLSDGVSKTFKKGDPLVERNWGDYAYTEALPLDKDRLIELFADLYRAGSQRDAEEMFHIAIKYVQENI